MKTTWRGGALLLLVWAGCEGATGPTGTNPATEPDDPSPYIFDEGPAPEPSEQLADVEAALQQAIDLTLTVNAAPVRAAYDDVMTHSDGGCPYYYDTPDGSYWLDSCMTPSGATYDGYVFSLDTVDAVDPASGLTYSVWYAFGGAAVTDPTGHLLEIGGAAIVQSIRGFVGDNADIPYVSHASQLQGSFHWDGPSASGTFLEQGIDPDLTIQLQEIPDFGRVAVLTGGFGGFGEGWALAWDDNVLFTSSLGSSCPEELSGTVAVRSPGGEWYDVRFDGPANENVRVPSAECDGCGLAYFQGVAVGQVCVDASPLLTWEGSPW